MNTKGSLGFLGAFFLLGAGLRFGSQASPPSSSPKPPAQPRAAAASTTPDDRDGPWWAACEFFLHEPTARWLSAPGVDPRWSCVPVDQRMRFLIATVPDPKRTHLALYFDRSIESIVAAAEAAGYTLEQFWVPWSSQPERDLPLLRDRERREKDLDHLYEKPGLLAFRGDSEALFIFLVGETPTTGVDEEALRVAIKAIDYLSGGDRLTIAGPAFSGSSRLFAPI